MHDTYRFLRLFREEKEEVVVALLHENPLIQNDWGALGKARDMYHLEMKTSKTKQPLNRWIGYDKKQKFYIKTNNEKLGKAVFFVVNIGGKTNKEIAENGEVRSYFIDVDFAKEKYVLATKEIAEKKAEDLRKKGIFQEVVVEQEKNGDFVVKTRYIKRVIEDKKERFRKKYARYLMNTVMVETYSGFHVYWLVKQASTKTFSSVQRALQEKFGGDPKVKNLSRLMRIPGFVHQKYEEQFLVKVVKWSDKYWTEEEIVEELGLNLQIPQTNGFVKEEHKIPIRYNSEVKTSFKILVPREKPEIVFKKHYGVKTTNQMTFREVLEEIKKEKLTTFIESPNMELDEKIHCPFHRDSKPSANTFISRKNEHLFSCHACEIGTKNVIGLYMAARGTGFRATVNDLARMLGIKIVKTEYEEDQLEKYQDNRMFLNQDLETMFPNIAHYINKYDRKAFLRYFNDTGEVNISKEEYSYKENNIFFNSFRHVAREMHKTSHDTVTRTVYLLNVLGFVERVPENEVNEELIKRSKIELVNLKERLSKQGEKGKKEADLARAINYYIVTRWTEKAMEIEANAKLMLEKNFALKNINKIELELLLGKEAANRVFPDERVVPKRFQSIFEKIKTAIEEEIRKKGFAVKEEILKKKIRIGKGGKEIVTLKEKEEIFERSIKEIVGDKYKIISVRSPKKKEEMYGYTKPTPKSITVIELKVD